MHRNELELLDILGELWVMSPRSGRCTFAPTRLSWLSSEYGGWGGFCADVGCRISPQRGRRVFQTCDSLDAAKEELLRHVVHEHSG